MYVTVHMSSSAAHRQPSSKLSITICTLLHRVDYE